MDGRVVRKGVPAGPSLDLGEIARKLFVTEATVKSHLSSAFAKFGVSSRREAATLFLELDGRQK